MKRLFRKNNGEEHNFWMSYTDLLSGFLIVFIIATIIYQSQQNKIFGEIRKEGFDNVQDVLNMVHDYKFKANLTNINDEFKHLLIDSLHINAIEFDSIEQSIRFYPTEASLMLFQPGKVEMEPDLRNRIITIGSAFVSEAMKISDSLYNGKESKMEIRIEGHTDTTKDFMYNLDLSSKRAYSVYKCIHDDCNLTPEQKKFVEKQMICVGYSYAKPLDHNGKLLPFNSNKVDLSKSRRIEFRIISK